MNNDVVPRIVPFEEIAVAISGGGFRAACFGLGVLSYLNRVQYHQESLLSHVRFISSASGGSITNLYYSTRIERGEPFESIYESLTAALRDEQIIARAFTILNDSSRWARRPHKGRNLINAFAMAYDELLFQGEDFTHLRNNLPAYVDEVCINATEFTHGITFRFQAGGSGLVGNKYLHFRQPRVADKLKLGDILAASSCFPMGFEPIMFPQDFAHEKLSVQELADAFQQDEANAPDARTTFTSVGLMDGGITDNQGVYSFMLAEERKQRTNQRGYDLFLACDVASSYMDAYTIPGEKRGVLGGWKLSALINILRLSLGLFAGGVLALTLWQQPGWLWVTTTLAGVLGMTYLAGAWALVRGKKAMIQGSRTWGVTLFKYIGSLLTIRVSALRQMMSARIKSVGIMTGDVYLKQIRRLTFMSLYQNDDTGAKWRMHAIANFIYELAPINKQSRRRMNWQGYTYSSGAPAQAEPSALLEQVAHKAQQMDTTLWFDAFQVRDDVQEALLATGQFTTCYNLINYLDKLMANGYDAPELRRLHQRLLDDWQRFQQDPSFMASPQNLKKAGVLS